MVWKCVSLHCSDGVSGVFNFTDEWSHISDNFSDKFHSSFESGNSVQRLIIAKAHRQCIIVNINCKEIMIMWMFPQKRGVGPTLEQYMSVLYILFWCVHVALQTAECHVYWFHLFITVLLMVHWSCGVCVCD